jgi:hypothetical protein
MDNLQIKESDLASFAGLAVVIPMLVGVIKGLFKQWITGREPMLCVALTFLVGIVAKQTIPGAFGGVGWLTLLISLLIVAGLAAQVHDFAVNKVMRGRDGSEPPSTSGGAGGAK